MTEDWLRIVWIMSSIVRTYCATGRCRWNFHFRLPYCVMSSKMAEGSGSSTCILIGRNASSLHYYCGLYLFCIYIKVAISLHWCVTWASWCLKSLATRLFVQLLVQAKNKETLKPRIIIPWPIESTLSPGPPMREMFLCQGIIMPTSLEVTQFPLFAVLLKMIPTMFIW